MGHHQDAKRAHSRIVPGRGGGIGSAALVDQAVQRALLGGGQRLVVGTLRIPGGLEGSAGVLGRRPCGRPYRRRRGARPSPSGRFAPRRRRRAACRRGRCCAPYRWPTGTSCRTRCDGRSSGSRERRRRRNAPRGFPHARRTPSRPGNTRPRRAGRPHRRWPCPSDRSPPRCARWIRKTWSTARRSDRTKARGECPLPAHQPNLSFGARATSSGVEAPTQRPGANKQYRQS